MLLCTLSIGISKSLFAINLFYSIDFSTSQMGQSPPRQTIVIYQCQSSTWKPYHREFHKYFDYQQLNTSNKEGLVQEVLWDLRLDGMSKCRVVRIYQGDRRFAPDTLDWQDLSTLEQPDSSARFAQRVKELASGGDTR